MPSDARLEILSSRGLPGWLADANTSLAFTTYQAGKLFLLGLQPDGRLSLFERSFNRCMGLCAHAESLWLSTLFQVWRLENALPAGHVQDGHDRLYVPRVAHTTGDLDVHDLAVTSAGQVVFVNTLFSCLATLSDRASFVPLWRPPFISRLAAEDRCHLNGLALADGAPAAGGVTGGAIRVAAGRHIAAAGCLAVDQADALQRQPLVVDAVVVAPQVVTTVTAEAIVVAVGLVKAHAVADGDFAGGAVHQRPVWERG